MVVEEGQDLDEQGNKEVGKGQTTKALNNGLVLFKKEFFNKLKGKKDDKCVLPFNDALEAWRALSDRERKEYCEKAKYTQNEKKAIMEKKTTKRKIPFITRSSIRQFKQLADFISKDTSLKDRVERLGFGKLLEVGGCNRLPKDLIASMLRSYDPPTHQFRIRGKTREILAVDVHQLLGVPHGGELICGDVDDDDPVYTKLKSEYSKRLYSKIFEAIIGGGENDHFEFLFMLYTLGTFLAPTASPKVSYWVLKVMSATIKGFEKFDWATFIIQELWKEMEDYVRAVRKNKTTNTNVGGCVYLLLLYFGEHFTMVTTERHQYGDAIKYWTEERFKEMVKLERESNMGILFGGTASQTYVQPEDNIGIDHLDQDLKDMYRRLTRVIAEELIKVQVKRGGQEKINGQEDHKKEMDPHAHDVHNVVAAKVEENYEEEEKASESDFGDSPISVSDSGVKGGDAVEDEEVGMGQVLRRSCRVRKEKKIESPYVMPKEIKRKKKEVDDKERFFHIISQLPPSIGGDK